MQEDEVDNILTLLWKMRQRERAWNKFQGLRMNGFWDFPGGAVVKNPPANAGDMGYIPGPGRPHMPWSN